MVVVLALGRILLPPPTADWGEVVDAMLPRLDGAYGAYGADLSGSVEGMGCAEAISVAKTSFRGDWRAGGGATSVVSMLRGAFSERPFLSGNESEGCWSGCSGVIAGAPKVWKDGGGPWGLQEGSYAGRCLVSMKYLPAEASLAGVTLGICDWVIASSDP